MSRTMAVILVATLGIFGLANAQVAKESLKTPRPVSQMEVGKVKIVSKDELAPELRKMAEEDIEKAQKNTGTGSKRGPPQLISDEEAAIRKNYHSRLLALHQIRGKSKTQLGNISSTDLSRYEFEGVIPDGPSREGPWSSFVRVFKRPDGVLVTLYEWDFIADGGGVVALKETLNAKVLKYPAQFSTAQSPAGQFISELRWITNRKIFHLRVWDDVSEEKDRQYNRRWLFQMAERIK
jgi:hypothetical protein